MAEKSSEIWENWGQFSQVAEGEAWPAKGRAAVREAKVAWEAAVRVAASSDDCHSDFIAPAQHHPVIR